MYAHEVGYEEITINKVPCLSATSLHGNHQPTSSTAPPLPLENLPAQRLSMSPVGNPRVRDLKNTQVDRSKVSGEGFDEEMRLFLMLLRFVVLNIKERRVHPEELETILIKKAWRR